MQTAEQERRERDGEPSRVERRADAEVDALAERDVPADAPNALTSKRSGQVKTRLVAVRRAEVDHHARARRDRRRRRPLASRVVRRKSPCAGES